MRNRVKDLIRFMRKFDDGQTIISEPVDEVIRHLDHSVDRVEASNGLVAHKVRN